MKKYMDKIIITPGRVGGYSVKNRHKNRIRPEDMENYEGKNKETIRDPHKNYAFKEQTDFLAPMERFLNKNVGRLWDDVWSEVCESTHHKTLLGDHFRNHLKQYVEVHCGYDKNGNIVGSYGYSVDSDLFYVHPETRILHRGGYKRTKYRPKREQPPFVKMNGITYFQHEGFWYRVKMKPLHKKPISLFKDVFGVTVNIGLFAWNWAGNFTAKYGRDSEGRVQYCEHKESANSKEIKKLNSLHKKVA